MGKLLMFKNLLKTGRLALRLARDHRVPLGIEGLSLGRLD